MFNVRNWYIYIVCAISLQAVTWSTIDLMRNLFVFGVDPTAVAFQIAVIIVGLPVFLVHWLWAQRLANKTVEERGGTLRRLFLYGNMAAFLGSFIPNTFDLFSRLLGGPPEYGGYGYQPLSLGDTIIFHVIALLVLPVLWFYLQRVVVEDAKIIPETGSSATVRRLYVLGFSVAGLSMTTHSVIRLLRWIIQELRGSVIKESWLRVLLTDEVVRLVIGVTLWLLFWRWAQRLFYGPSEEEHNANLRKVYLYGAIFFGAMDAVAQTTGILASLIRRILDVTSTTKSDISQPLPIIIGMGLLWAYHAHILHKDTQQTRETSRQVGIRRLYYYLIAGIGLSALLVGIAGDISVLLRSLDTNFGAGLKEDFSWFTSAIIAGLPVWIIPWRKVNMAALSPDPSGMDERRSVVRKVYLYFFLFIATMTLLSSTVFIIFRILSMVLGEDPLTLTELGHAISFSLIAVGVMLYHGRILRGDAQFAKHERTSFLQAMHVLVIDIGEGLFGQSLTEAIKREIPDISLETITLPVKIGEAEGAEIDHEKLVSQISKAQLIVAPWMVAVAGAACGVVSAQVAEAIVASTARKVLVPMRSEEWEWVGIDRWSADDILHHTVRAVKQITSGESVKIHRPLGAAAIIGIVIAVLIILGLITSLLFEFFI